MKAQFTVSATHYNSICWQQVDYSVQYGSQLPQDVPEDVGPIQDLRQL